MKPYVILHMLISIDGKITGDYMNTKTAEELCNEYYRINREYKADGFLCGRITMEGSFTNWQKPDLAKYQGIKLPHEDCVQKQHNYYAVSVDPHGKMGWYGSEIMDEDPGYDNAHIIEVLTDDINDEYLAFLKDKGISYIFCGKEKIDVNLMNQKLYSLFGIKKLMLEGGGITDSLFLDGDCIDEMSLVVVPLVDGSKDGIDLFANKNCNLQEYELLQAEKLKENGLWLNYKKKSK
ncbi:MAG: dihydrofolate reductase family protein [Clostridia bacterium]|nr:dihydrofolate reductase family protein [Clostridia bacterium]